MKRLTQENENEIFKDLDFEKQKVEKSFSKCKFINCNFSETDLSKSVFRECEFEKCTFLNNKVYETRFEETTFFECKVLGINFSEINKFHPGLSFDKCKLSFCVFSNLKIKDFKLINSSATENDFYECELINSSFENTDLEKTTFSKNQLAGSSFLDAKNYFIDFKSNNFKKSRFNFPNIINSLASLGVEVIE